MRLQLPRGLNLMIEQNAKGVCEEWLNLARDEKRRRHNTASRSHSSLACQGNTIRRKLCDLSPV